MESLPPVIVGSPKDTPLEDTPLEDNPSEGSPSSSESDDDDDAKARLTETAVFVAWAENVPGDLTPILRTKLTGLIAECGAEAVIHGIVTAVETNARNFKYIAKCARNHAKGGAAASNGYRNYHVDLPVDTPGSPAPPPPQPKPAASIPSSPWDICLNELQLSMTPETFAWLTASVLIAVGEVPNSDGDPVPLYQIVVQRADGVGWLTHQAGTEIRRRLSSILGQPVQIEIVAAQQNEEPTHA